MNGKPETVNGSTRSSRSLFTVYALSFPPVWTGVRVAEGAGLENRYTRKGIVGSNPTLSAVTIRNGRDRWSGHRMSRV